MLWVVKEISVPSCPILISMNRAISGKIFGKLSRFPRSEIFYPTLGEDELVMLET